MFSKLTIILLATLFLGGCNLTWPSPNAASDTQSPTPYVASSPVPQQVDPELDEVKETSSDTDVTSIEADLNNTVILQEDFSDLE